MNSRELKYVEGGPFVHYEEKMLKQSGLGYFWHYTSVDAFINIVKGKEIRLTDCLFLNDIDEFNYIFKVIDKYVKEKREHYEEFIDIKHIFDKDNYDYLIVKSENGKGSTFTDGRYYVLSGSSNPDSLPMWNYYSKNGKYEGYSVKFDIAKIFKNFENYKQGRIIAGKVVYKIDEQLDIIENTVAQIYRDFDKKKKGLENGNIGKDNLSHELQELRDERKSELYYFVNTCRLFFKSTEFEHESEIRIAVLCSINTFKDQKLNPSFNEVKGVIKPSVGLSLEPFFPISEVVVSPIIDERLADKGIKRLFEAYNIKPNSSIKISKSKIKIRY